MYSRTPGPNMPVQRTGADWFCNHMERIGRGIVDHPWRAVGIAGSVAAGVAIAIAIISASNGIEIKINDLLGTGTQGRADQLRQAGVNMNDIQTVLGETRNLLTKLSVVFTAALVGIVTWVTLGQERREIAIERMRGQHIETVIGELVGRSFLLCVVGGIVGIVLGLTICNITNHATPLLPMNPALGDILAIFPATTLITFAVTAIIAAVFAKIAKVDSN